MLTTSPQLAQLGLPAARRYAANCPHGAACVTHAIAYLCPCRLVAGRHQFESRSIAATRQTAAMHMGGEGHQFHAMDFLFYAYLQSGRDADAKALIEEVKTMQSTVHDMYGMGFDPRMRPRWSVFRRYVSLEMRHWQDAARLLLWRAPTRPEDSVITTGHERLERRIWETPIRLGATRSRSTRSTGSWSRRRRKDFADASRRRP